MNKAKKKRRWIWLIVIVVIIAAVFVSCQVMQQQALTAQRIASIKTAKAETAGITKTVSGSGTLEAQDTLDVQTVSGVKIDEVLVEEGDSVAKGQTLATLDQAELEELAADTNIAIQQMDMELKRLSGKEADKYVRAPVEGRVKQIFVKEGNYASDITADKNALMVLSTDGNMKAEFKPTGKVSIGQSVYVKDGSKTYSAKITAVSGDTCTALFTDDGPRVGKTAAVLAKNMKTELGKGVLAVNSPIAINAAGGKIEKIYVDLNEKVSRNEKLLKMEDNPLSSDYIKKLAERDQKSKDYALILSLLNNPVITAGSDGVVKEALVKDGEYAESDSKNDTQATVFRLNATNLKLNVSLDELDMPFVKEGQTASVSFDALPAKEIGAAVERISSLGTSENGNTKYSVILNLSETEGLYAGMSATATITVETKQNVVALPLETLQEENGENFVYMDSGVPGVLGEARRVKTGLSDGKTVEITEGLQAGETIMYQVKLPEDYFGFSQQGGNGMFSGMRQGANPQRSQAPNTGTNAGANPNAQQNR